MVSHSFIHCVVKIIMFIINIIIYYFALDKNVYRYNVWAMFVSCVVSIVYAEYYGNFGLKMFNFISLIIFIALFMLGYYQKLEKKLKELLTTRNFNIIIAGINNICSLFV